MQRKKRESILPMKKKGISPLIATVLIIGFTVALGATIMIWGRGFIQDSMQKEGEMAEARLSCVSAEFTVDRVCKNAENKVEVTVRNTQSETIDGFIFRSTELTDTIEHKTELKGLTAETITLDLAKIPEILDIVPLQKSGSKYQPCSVQTKSVRAGTIEDCLP